MLQRRRDPIDQPCSPLLRWIPATYREYAPTAATATAIECLWTSLSHEAQRVSVFPDGCVDLMLRGRGTTAGQTEGVTLEIVGAMTSARAVEVVPGTFHVGVRFRPGYARRLFAMPLHEITDRQVPLAAAWGARAEVVAKLFCAAEHPDALALLLTTLTERALQEHDAMQCALDRFVASQGTLPLEALHDTAGRGERQFRRMCLERTGLAPKRLGQILRVRRVTELLQSSPYVPLSALAQTMGYADQAHMTREVRMLTGQTPGMLQPAADDRFLQDVRGPAS
jgi:AraC-like DNA-binding protein